MLLAKEVGRTLAREGNNSNLAREHWAGPWRVSVVVQPGLCYEAMLSSRQARKRTVSTPHRRRRDSVTAFKVIGYGQYGDAS